MIADLHGGNFGLESTSNSGTVFFLELDLCEGSSDIESNLITSFSSKTCERTIHTTCCSDPIMHYNYFLFLISHDYSILQH